MHTRGTNAFPLAPRPSLEEYKKLAKDLLKAARTGDVGAVRQWAIDWLDRIEWQPRGDDVGEILTDAKDVGLIGGEPSLATAQFFLARLHGFESWPRFAKHIEDRNNASSPVARFETAADAIVNGDIATLRKLLHDHPELARARSTRDHNATLLHYVAANGHEGFRQRTPKTPSRSRDCCSMQAPSLTRSRTCTSNRARRWRCSSRARIHTMPACRARSSICSSTMAPMSTASSTMDRRS